MINKENDLHLFIADFHIRIVFTPIRYPSASRKFLISSIIENYAAFIKKTNDAPNFTVLIKDVGTFSSLVKHNKIYYFGLYKLSKVNVVETYYHLSPVQFFIVLRNIVSLLLARSNGFFLHASSCKNTKGSAFVFLGDSGNGKSTIIHLLQNMYCLLADDILIIRKIGRRYYLFQTPFDEKGYHMKKTPYKYSIDRIYVLQKDKHVKAVHISEKEITSLFLNQLIVNNDTKDAYIRNAMAFISSTIDLYYKLSFPKSKKMLQNFFMLEKMHK